MKNRHDSNVGKLARRTRVAVATIGVVLLYVLIYAAMSPSSKTLAQISSLVVLGGYLGVLVLMGGAKLSGRAVAIYIVCSTIAGIGFAVIWEWTPVRAAIAIAILCLLSISSKWWLRTV